MALTINRFNSFLMLLAAVSCSVVEEVGSTTITDNSIIIGADTESDADTKTRLESTRVLWDADDVIKVYNAQGDSGDFTLISGAGTSSANFKGTLPASATYFSLYPASSATGFDKTGRILTFDMPVVQSYAAGGFARNADPLVAYGDDRDRLQFKNACGILRLVIKGSETVTSIKLTDLAGAPVCGKAVINMSYGADGPSVNLAEGGSSSVTLECPQGVVLDSDGVEFNIVVPPNTLGHGFNILIRDSSGNAMDITAPENEKNMIRRNSIKVMPALVYKANTSSFTFIEVAGIYNLAEPEIQALAHYSLDSFPQCTVNIAGSAHEMQLIDWKGLQLVVVTAEADTLTPGESYTLTIRTRSFNALSDGSVNAELVKVSDKFLYFTDNEHRIGYVIPR